MPRPKRKEFRHSKWDYTHGCRCEVCRAHNNANHRAWAAKNKEKVSAINRRNYLKRKAKKNEQEQS